MTAAEADKLHEEAVAEMNEGHEQARKENYPSADSIFDHVFAPKKTE